jgi:hypothetical protein
MISHYYRGLGSCGAKIYSLSGKALIVGLVLSALLFACGSPDHDTTVRLNLSLVVDSTQAKHWSLSSRLIAFIERWVIGGTSTWAQAVSDIRTIQVQILGPDLPIPPTTTVSVTNPTSGQEISVSIQAPAGPNRTITVIAFNSAMPPQKIFSGIAPDVALIPGTPVNLTVVLTPANTHHLTINNLGAGTVTSTPSAISCGPTCAADFPSGSSVTLTAVAPAGSTFSGWNGGGCSGNGACTVMMNADLAVTAIFGNSLTVTKAGAGQGTVSSSPVGIDCGFTCIFGFPPNSSVTLTATAPLGSTFGGWNNGCSGTETCVVLMDTDKSVTATFNAAPSTLTVTKLGTAGGTVTSSPAGIDCGTMCSALFPTGSQVTLMGTASAGSTFVGWSGGGCGATATCTTVMPPIGQTVFATFNLAPTFTLNISGTGGGTVAISPADITCNSTCSSSFPQGTRLELTAMPNGASTFAGWSGADCAGTGSCIVVMNGDQTVTAQFN